MALKRLGLILILFIGLVMSGCQKSGPDPEYEKAPEQPFENCC